MRIEDLKIFVDVVRYHSMNIASEKNFTTPQNLSKIIKNMESELGATLLKRSKKGSALTVEGERFYLHILEALSHYDEAVNSLQDKMVGSEIDGANPIEDKKIDVLCTQGVMSYAVIDTFNEVQGKPYNILLDEDVLSFYSAHEILNYQKGREYSIIATVVQPENMELFVNSLKNYTLMHVLYDEMVLIVSKDNPLSGRSMVHEFEIAHQKIVSFKDLFWHEDIFGPDFQYQIKTSSVANALEQVRRSESYCTILSKSLVNLNEKVFEKNDGLKIVPLERKRYSTYVILLNKQCFFDKGMIKFVRKLAEHFIEKELF